MPDIIALANKFRADLLAGEREGAVRMIRAYGGIWNRLSQEIARLNKQIAEAEAAGQVVNQSWLLRQKRYRDLLTQTNEEFTRFSQIADSRITKQQQQAISSARDDSMELMAAAAENVGIKATFNRLPAAAVENMAGFLGNGSPLKSLLDQLPRDGRRVVEEGLLEAVALGQNPATTARKIREGLGGNLKRALTISRTETLRAYRTATIQTYQANADTIKGWVWRSARSRRSCASCIALDGTFHLTNEHMKNHVRCRCTLIPSVRHIKVDKGEDWFDRQDEATQAEIIGTQAGFKAFKEGKLKLRDFVGLERNAQWGDSYFQLSVKRALAGEGQFPGGGSGITPLPIPGPTPALAPKTRKRRQKLQSPPSGGNLPQGEGARIRAKLDLISAKAIAKRQAITDERNQLFNNLSKTSSREEERKIFNRINDLNKKEKKTYDQVKASSRRAIYQSKMAVFKTDVQVKSPYLKDDIIPPGVHAFRRLIGGDTDLDALKTIKIRELKGTTDRSYYSNNFVYIARNDRDYIVVHELGHWLEQRDPKVKKAVFDFYAKRTKNDNLEKLSILTGDLRYKPYEVTKKDKWANPYVGRFYPDKRGKLAATEVLSMGVQEIYRDPQNFAKTDPEYFDFIIEVLRIK